MTAFRIESKEEEKVHVINESVREEQGRVRLEEDSLLKNLKS